MPSYNVLIQNAKVIDGTGNPWFYGDVATQGEKIATITPPHQIDPKNSAEIINAAGMVVCPGFIDIQSNSIAPLMVDGRSVSKITQGVTTEIMGEGCNGFIQKPFNMQALSLKLKEVLES